MLRARMQEASNELWDLLLNKEAWVALLGMLVAVAKWQGLDIPMEVFVTIEVLILAIIAALVKKA